MLFVSTIFVRLSLKLRQPFIKSHTQLVRIILLADKQTNPVLTNVDVRLLHLNKPVSQSVSQTSRGKNMTFFFGGGNKYDKVQINLKL